jgi:hypothetical protein
MGCLAAHPFDPEILQQRIARAFAVLAICRLVMLTGKRHGGIVRATRFLPW